MSTPRWDVQRALKRMVADTLQLNGYRLATLDREQYIPPHTSRDDWLATQPLAEAILSMPDFQVDRPGWDVSCLVTVKLRTNPRTPLFRGNLDQTLKHWDQSIVVLCDTLAPPYFWIIPAPQAYLLTRQGTWALMVPWIQSEVLPVRRQELEDTARRIDILWSPEARREHATGDMPWFIAKQIFLRPPYGFP